MKYYWVKTHRIVRWLLPNILWKVKTRKKTVYLTFDDGPTPEITEWVLSQLRVYDAKATFFCIGNNIKNHPEIFSMAVYDRHKMANHTFDHLNGWETKTEDYIKNAVACKNQLHLNGVAQSNLFRPPYGKVNWKQSKLLKRMGYKIVMWDILSADFDADVSPEKCLENVLKNIEPGSIIIFHDSIKAFANLKYVLPKTLAFLDKEGYQCEVID